MLSVGIWFSTPEEKRFMNWMAGTVVIDAKLPIKIYED